MDSLKNEKHGSSSTKLKKSPSMKKALQILVPISLFSLLFSYQSWLPWSLHLPNSVFTSLVPLFLNYIMNRKFMFFLCNGILVFLARDSGLFGSRKSAGIDLYDEFIKQTRNHSRLDSETPEKKTQVGEREEKPKKEQREDQRGIIVVEEEAPEQEGEERGKTVEEEDGDELNRRIENYIKKVNQRRRLEALQLVVRA